MLNIGDKVKIVNNPISVPASFAGTVWTITEYLPPVFDNGVQVSGNMYVITGNEVPGYSSYGADEADLVPYTQIQTAGIGGFLGIAAIAIVILMIAGRKRIAGIKR
jgi:hypothetical protein